MIIFTWITEAEVNLLLSMVKNQIPWWEEPLTFLFKKNKGYLSIFPRNLRLVLPFITPYKKIPLRIYETGTSGWHTAVYLWRLQIGK